jgi:hypothetical protein
MYKCFDLMEVQQQHAMKLVHVLKDVLLRIHHGSFSLDDYYLMVNELLRGALTSMAAHFNQADTQLIAFKNNMEGMFHHWNALAPSLLHDGKWAAELTNIIAQAKDGKHKTEAEGSSLHSKGNEVMNRKSSISGNCQTTPLHHQ